MKKIFTLLFVLSFGLLFSNTSKINNSKTIACPTASISYSGSPFCTNISTPQAVTLTGTDVFLGGTFASTDGLFINAVTGAITPNMSTPGTYTITYTLISGGGCPIVTATTDVIISVTPTATIGFNQTICAGNTTTITFTGTPNATISYTINGGAVQNITLNSSGTAALPTGLLTSNTVYNLVSVSSATGCSNPVSGSATITVIPSPIIFGSPSICVGNITQFTGTGIPATSTPWTSSNIAVATVNSTGLVSAMSPGITTITYRDINGCTTTQSIAVNPIPTVTVNNSTICPGETAIVTTATGESGTYSYVWTVPAGATNPGNVASFTTTTAGTYSVVAIKNGCSSSSASGVVTVNPTAGAFNLQCSTPIPNQVYVDWSNVVGITNFNYSYSINGGPMITGSQSAPSSMYITNNGQPVTFTLSGTGTVCVAPETITCGTLSTDENNINNFVISPNPVTDILSIKNNQIINRVTTFNQLGQVVLQKEYNTNEIQLDFSALKTGIYFIYVDSDKKQSTFKIVKN